MKKMLFILFLCLSLVGICACVQTVPSAETTTITTAEETVEMPTSAVAPSTVEIRPDEIAPYTDVLNEWIDFFRAAAIDVNFDILGRQYYAFYDIDGNGTKELLFGQERERVCLEVVYTIQDGVAVQQEEYFEDYDFMQPSSLFKNGTIMARRGVVEGNQEFFTYYCFVAGELKRQVTLIEDTFYLEKNRYFHRDLDNGDTLITRAEFDRLQKEFEGDGQVVELDWKPLAEWGR